MKKILSMLMMLFCFFAVQAQTDVTTFLGIPVDGFKSEMRKKLIAKGFTPVPGQDCLTGEFNGTNVNVYIGTNNNKVYRIMLCDVDCQDEANIKNRFNILIRQFDKNSRYLAYKNTLLTDSDNISYEMLVNKKVYEAEFFQRAVSEYGDAFKKSVWFRIEQFEYGKYVIVMYYDNEYNHANGEDL